MKLISVIVTTYNWPEALGLCLDSLFHQSDRKFEIIVADDGSKDEYSKLIRATCENSPVPIEYLHHEDKGFRAGTIRNKAVAASRGEYLLFVDGDCMMRPDFVSRHRTLAEARHFVPGNRLLLSRDLTKQVINERWPVYLQSGLSFVLLRLFGKINRLMPLLKLPLGPLRYLRPRQWEKAMTCNLGVWKSDFITVNGFDEVFEGWGYEDSDLVIRLIHAGVKRKEGRFAVPVFHLWHNEYDRSRESVNYQRLMQRLSQNDCIVADRGVSQYLSVS